MANLKAQTSSDSRQAERGMPNGLEERSAERELSLDLQPEQSTDCEMMEKLSWMIYCSLNTQVVDTNNCLFETSCLQGFWE